MIGLDIFGMFVGHLIGEHVFQSERIAATKRSSKPEDVREAILAWAVHCIVWTACVVMGGLIGSGQWSALLNIGFLWLLVAAGVLHYLIDCTEVRDMVMHFFGLPSLVSAIDQIQDMEEKHEGAVDEGWMNVMISAGLIYEKQFDLAVHSAILYAIFLLSRFVS